MIHKETVAAELSSMSSVPKPSKERKSWMGWSRARRGREHCLEEETLITEHSQGGHLIPDHYRPLV